MRYLQHTQGTRPGEKGVFFDNLAWHYSEKYSGERWSMLAYTTRGFKKAAPKTTQKLRGLGFPC